MESKEELQKRLAALRLEYRGRRSMLEMMEKGTTPEDLAKLRGEQLDPIKEEIERVEEAVKNLV